MSKSLHRTRRVLAAAFVSAGLLVATTACSPITTNLEYSSSDGVRTTVGDVAIVNLLIIATEDGSAGRLLGAFTNTGTEKSTLAFSVTGVSAPLEFPLDPKQTLNISTNDEAISGPPLIITDLNVKPGSNASVTLTVGETTTEVAVPVLGGNLPEYKDFVPNTAATE